MHEPLRLDIATEEVAHRIRVRPFLAAIDAVTVLLRELDKTVGLNGGFEWYLTELAVGSGVAVFGAEWVGGTEATAPTFEEIAAAEDRIARRWIKGLEELDREPSWPQDFTHEALEAAKRLADIERDEIVSITVSTARFGRTEITERIIANVNDLVRSNYVALGAVEGIVETVSLARGQRVFRVRNEADGRSVVCYFDDSQFSTIRDALGRRVSVRGQLGYSKYGRLAELRSVGEIHLLEQQDGASWERAFGIAPDFTDGLPAEVFLDQLHDDSR